MNAILFIACFLWMLIAAVKLSRVLWGAIYNEPNLHRKEACLYRAKNDSLNLNTDGTAQFQYI